jgi:DNA-directed RNA polymerase subunit RPC12/RpoP
MRLSAFPIQEVTMTTTPTMPLARTGVRCPGCGSSITRPVNAAAPGNPPRDNLLCTTCGTCWHLTPAGAERVDPRQCPGCSLRRICTAAQGLTFSGTA